MLRHGPSSKPFAEQPVMLFVGPSVLAIGAMALYAFILPDQHMPTKPPRMNLAEWVTTFWVSPRKAPDFALAWWSRFLIILSTFMFTTFRLFYLQDRIGLAPADAPAAVTTGVLVYTIALVASGWIAGKISDRTGRRKMLVAGSALLAVGSVQNQNYTLMLYVAGALALIGALVVLPIKSVR